MGMFNTKAMLYGNPDLIPTMADRICDQFALDGYEVKRDNLISGGTDISVTKGGIFKAVLGMKTALKVTLVPSNNAIAFDAGVGIFGQQAIPTIIMFFFAWPVLLTQLWGMIQQAELDDKALAAAQSVLNENGGRPNASAGAAPQTLQEGGKFCTNCGAKLPANARFCSNCGSPLS